MAIQYGCVFTYMGNHGDLFTDLSTSGENDEPMDVGTPYICFTHRHRVLPRPTTMMLDDVR